MDLFKKLFSPGNFERKFPIENGQGSIMIKGNKIVCEGEASWQNCMVNIDDIQYAYLIIDNDKQASLFLFDHHQGTLPAHDKGFQEVYLFLSHQFGFNDEIFFKNVHRTLPLKKEIWRKKETTNYQIMDGHYNDYGEGFEIQSPAKEFIGWDTTYEMLGKNQHAFFEKSPYDQDVLKFSYAVRLGNVMLKNLAVYYDNARKDVPILQLYAACFSQDSSDESYKTLKAVLKKDISNSEKVYEREDQCHYRFETNGISISLVYTYDSDWQYDGGYTSLMIQNERSYPELLVDADYENKMEISHYILLNNGFTTHRNYKNNSSVKRRPPLLDTYFKKQPIIWIDHKNGQLGVADGLHSQLFDMGTINSFSIQNMLPAKGPGAAYLYINFNNTSTQTEILSGECKALDAYAKDIAATFGKEVRLEEEYYNC